MSDRHDDIIDKLIAEKGIAQSQRPRYVGFDWSRTDKLKPTGDADRANVLSRRYAEDMRA